MKKVSLAFLVLFFCGCSTQTRTDSPDEMVHKVFACLKAKDEDAFTALCPDAKQLERILERSAENTRAKIETERKAWREQSKNDPQPSSGETDSTIEASLQKSYSPEGVKKIREILRSNFRFVLQKGEKKGINWRAITLIRYTLDTAGTDQQTMRFSLGPSGYKSLNGLLHFKAGNDTFKMSVGDILYLPEENGWYGATPDRLVRESEPLEADHEGEEKTEVELVSVAREEPPPPPPPPPPNPRMKAKGKSSSAKTKP